MNQSSILATTEPTKNGARSDQRARDRLASKLHELGLATSPASFERVYRRVGQAEAQTGSLSDRQLQAIVDDAVAGEEALEGVAESFR